MLQSVKTKLERKKLPASSVSVSYTHLDVYKRQIQYSSTRDNFSESGVRKERVPKVRHRKVRRSC